MVPWMATDSCSVDPMESPEQSDSVEKCSEVDSSFTEEIAIPDDLDDMDDNNFKKEVKPGVSIPDITQFQVN